MGQIGEVNIPEEAAGSGGVFLMSWGPGGGKYGENVQ